MSGFDLNDVIFSTKVTIRSEYRFRINPDIPVLIWISPPQAFKIDNANAVSRIAAF